eukprot:GFYU01035820.1.p1 GENE.GFYU01035820.1~~GFYU01035820.1.p1  ORF type:complete len:142 (+),score=45.38 GFYU01035820.1:54-428(+)
MDKEAMKTILNNALLTDEEYEGGPEMWETFEDPWDMAAPGGDDDDEVCYLDGGAGDAAGAENGDEDDENGDEDEEEEDAEEEEQEMETIPTSELSPSELAMLKSNAPITYNKMGKASGKFQDSG